MFTSFGLRDGKSRINGERMMQEWYAVECAKNDLAKFSHWFRERGNLELYWSSSHLPQLRTSEFTAELYRRLCWFINDLNSLHMKLINLWMLCFLCGNIKSKSLNDSHRNFVSWKGCNNMNGMNKSSEPITINILARIKCFMTNDFSRPRW